MDLRIPLWTEANRIGRFRRILHRSGAGTYGGETGEENPLRRAPVKLHSLSSYMERQAVYLGRLTACQVAYSDEVPKTTVGYTGGLLICVGWQCRQVAHFYRLAVVTECPLCQIARIGRLPILASCPNRRFVEGAKLLIVAGCSKRQVADSDGLSIWAECLS